MSSEILGKNFRKFTVVVPEISNRYRLFIWLRICSRFKDLVLHFIKTYIADVTDHPHSSASAMIWS